MIVVVTIAKGNSSESNIFGFYSDGNKSNRKINERTTIYGKLVENGSVMENYAGCDYSCNSYNIG